MKKKIALLLLFSIFLCLTLVFFKSYSSEKETYTFTKAIQSIRIENDTAYFNFYNDDVDYIFYEYDQVSVDCFNQISVDDEITFMVAKDYQKFDYAIIYKMELNANVIFDSTQHYLAHDKNVAVVLGSLFVSICLVAMLLVLFDKPSNNTELSFMIRYNKILCYVFVITSVSSFVPFTSLLLMYLNNKIDKNFFLISISFAIIFIISSLGVLAYKNEYFSFDGDAYTFKFSFRKACKIRKNNISRVSIERTCLFTPFFFPSYKLIFFDKQNAEILKISNDFRIFNKLFYKSLQNNFKITKATNVKRWSLKHFKNFIKIKDDNVNVKIIFKLNNTKYYISSSKNLIFISEFGKNDCKAVEFHDVDEMFNSLIFNKFNLKKCWRKIGILKIID